MSSMDQDDLRHIIAAVLTNASAQTDDLKTPKALVRRLIEQGAEIPECLNVTPFIRASIVKA